MAFNEKLSYTEHNVTSPTSDFTIGFEDYAVSSKDRINVTVNDVDAKTAGYTVRRKNNLVVTLTPAVQSGVVRLQRETNIDTPFHRFTAGAKFVASNVDQNFNQILHSQQELRNLFGFTQDYIKYMLDNFELRIRGVEALVIDLRKDVNILDKRISQEVLDRIQGDTYLKNYIDSLINGVTGAEFLPITDLFVVGKSGRTQRAINDDTINVLDFGAVLYGLGDSTNAIQNAIDYASSKATSNSRRTVTIDIPIAVSKRRTHSTGWGSCLIVPSNVNIVGTGVIYTAHNYNSRSIIFLCRGSNIDIQNLSFENTLTTGNYDIAVGGGSTYDDGLVLGTTYKNITCYNLQTYKNWIGLSFQMKREDDGSVIFEDINYLLCRSIAREGNTSSGNFNFRSDPPHKIKNASMSLCHAENGSTASSFNYVGIKGGHVTNCVSKDNLYAGCELENGSEDITVSNLTSLDDYAALWIDDSSSITANGITVINTKESVTSPLLTTRGKVRPAIWITYQGFIADPTYVTENIFIRDVKGVNASILVERFGVAGEDYNPDVGLIHVDTITLNNDKTVNTTPIVVARSKKLVVLNATITSNPDIDCIRVGGTDIVKLENFTMTDVSKDLGGVNIVSTATRLTLRDSNISKLTVADITRNTYNNNHVLGAKLYELNSQIRVYPAIQGSPEGVLSASLGSEVTRLDDFSKYIKTTGTGNTGWRKIALV